MNDTISRQAADLTHLTERLLDASRRFEEADTSHADAASQTAITLSYAIDDMYECIKAMELTATQLNISDARQIMIDAICAARRSSQ